MIICKKCSKQKDSLHQLQRRPPRPHRLRPMVTDFFKTSFYEKKTSKKHEVPLMILTYDLTEKC
jgi:hypothetical protein